MRRQGKYEDALSVIDEMKSIYNPHLHSRVLMKEYITDHCVEIIAASTFWLHHFGRNDEALRLCDQVVDTMLPEIEAIELVTKSTILTPICRTLAKQRQSGAAKKALELYRTHVSDPVALAGGGDESSDLIKEGLKCLEASAKTLKKEDGTIVNSIAHSYYSQILSELENLSAPV
eukprot:scaffold19749_cov100-Skeletonema_marinoi.AAC.1